MDGSNVEYSTNMECIGGVCKQLEMDLNDVEASFMRI